MRVNLEALSIWFNDTNMIVGFSHGVVAEIDSSEGFGFDSLDKVFSVRYSEDGRFEAYSKDVRLKGALIEMQIGLTSIRIYGDKSDRFRFIDWCRDYAIDQSMNVWSRKSGGWQPLKVSKDGQVWLHKDGVRKSFSVKRLYRNYITGGLPFSS